MTETKTRTKAPEAVLSQACASENHYRCPDVYPDCECPRCHGPKEPTR